MEEAGRRAEAEGRFPDERLRLLFVCAHPDVDPAVRTPLMLQTVLGLDAARIGSAFLVAPTTMGQRLSRAKARIRDARLVFDTPDPVERERRADAVREAIYAAYAVGWDEPDASGGGLAQEAVWLSRALAELDPGDAETLGLLALVLHGEARRSARFDPEGGYVPLDEQDPALWSAERIEEAEGLLLRAARHRRIGRFQLEAAIGSAHAARRTGTPADPAAVARLYAALSQVAPSVGATVAHAAAEGRVRGPAAGLALLDGLPADRVRDFAPYWAKRAHLLAEAEIWVGAREAYDRALGLTRDPSVRAFLRGRAARCG